MDLIWLRLKTFFFIAVVLTSIFQNCYGSGTIQITLQNYVFRYDKQPLSEEELTLEALRPKTDAVIKNYSPLWTLSDVFKFNSQNILQEEEEESSTTPPLETNETLRWPFTDFTECGPPVKFRFVVCLDYRDTYDPNLPCTLARIETTLLPGELRPIPGRVIGMERVNFPNILGVFGQMDLIPNPIVIEFQEWKGPVNLAVYVQCCGDQRMDPKECEETLSTVIYGWPRALTMGTQTLRYSLQSSGSLSLAVSANCDVNYFGSSCDIFCKVDDQGEHKFCNSSTGLKQCLKGWSGDGCQDDVDECSEVICENGGVCENQQGSYKCVCPFGTRGRHCEARYPVCHLKPCQHQGTCLETSSGALCFCQAGFDGQWCNLLEGQAVEVNGRLDSNGQVDENVESFSTIVITPQPWPDKTTLIVRETVLQARDDADMSVEFHAWYLAPVFGLLFLIIIIVIIVAIFYRTKLRKRYSVNRPTSLPSAASLQGLTKTRSYNNAVYQRELQPDGLPYTIHSYGNDSIIFTPSASGGISSNNNNSSSSNNIKEDSHKLIEAEAAIPSSSRHPSNDHIVNNNLRTPSVEANARFNKADDKVLLTTKRKDQNGNDNITRAGKPDERHKYTGSAYIDADGSPGTSRATLASHHGHKYYEIDDAGAVGFDSSKQINSSIANYQPFPFHEPDSLSSQNMASKMHVPNQSVSNTNNGTRLQHLSRDTDLDTGTAKNPQSSEQSLRPQQGRGPLTRNAPYGRTSEHEYEDIDAESNFTSFRPKPKPRSIHFVVKKDAQLQPVNSGIDIDTLTGPEETQIRSFQSPVMRHDKGSPSGGSELILSVQNAGNRTSKYVYEYSSSPLINPQVSIPSQREDRISASSDRHLTPATSSPPRYRNLSKTGTLAGHYHRPWQPSDGNRKSRSSEPNIWSAQSRDQDRDRSHQFHPYPPSRRPKSEDHYRNVSAIIQAANENGNARRTGSGRRRSEPIVGRLPFRRRRKSGTLDEDREMSVDVDWWTDPEEDGGFYNSSAFV